MAPGPKCYVSTIELPDEIAADFAVMVEDPRVDAKALAAVLRRDYGIYIGPQSIRRHRRRLIDGGEGCLCPR